MARKVILCIFGVVVMIASYLYFFGSADVVQVKHDQQMNLKIDRPLELKQANPLIDSINQFNRGIASFYCDSLYVQGQVEGRSRAVKLDGMLAYQKPRHFRLQLDSVVGNELDIGSDGNVFWFWSKRMKEPGLYWARYEDLGKTRLKTPFNPYWLSGCLGHEEIDYKDAQIDQNNGKLRVIKTNMSVQNQPVKVVTIIDQNRRRVVGHGLYDANNTLVASSEIQEFYEGNVPKKVTFVWYKENAQVIWNFSRPKVNVGIGNQNWVMPNNRRPIIDLTRDHAGGFELSSSLD